MISSKSMRFANISLIRSIIEEVVIGRLVRHYCSAIMGCLPTSKPILNILCVILSGLIVLPCEFL